MIPLQSYHYTSSPNQQYQQSYPIILSPPNQQNQQYQQSYHSESSPKQQKQQSLSIASLPVNHPSWMIILEPGMSKTNFWDISIEDQMKFLENQSIRVKTMNQPEWDYLRIYLENTIDCYPLYTIRLIQLMRKLMKQRSQTLQFVWDYSDINWKTVLQNI